MRINALRRKNGGSMEVPVKNVPGKILNVLLVIIVAALAMVGVIFITGWVQDLTTEIILIVIDILVAFLLIRAITAKPRASTVSKGMPGEPGARPPRRRGRGRGIFLFFLFVVLVASVAVIAVVYKDYLPGPVAEEKVEITDQEVKEMLVSKSDLVTYSFEFDNVTEVKNTRQLFGHDVPFTTNTVTIKYSGVIKTGYDVSQVKTSVDNDKCRIYVTLPEVKVTDKYLYEDKLEYSEKNNIFNPISSDKISECLEEILNTELQRAEEQNIYGLAEENAKEIITNILSVYDEYTVIYK